MIYAYDEDIWQGTLKELWVLATQNIGQHVDIHQVDEIRSPAGYVSKYITKNVGSRFDSKEKRFGFSRHEEFRQKVVKPALCYEFRILDLKGKKDFRPISKYDLLIGDCN